MDEPTNLDHCLLELDHLLNNQSEPICFPGQRWCHGICYCQQNHIWSSLGELVVSLCGCTHPCMHDPSYDDNQWQDVQPDCKFGRFNVSREPRWPCTGGLFPLLDPPRPSPQPQPRLQLWPPNNSEGTRAAVRAVVGSGIATTFWVSSTLNSSQMRRVWSSS